MGPRSADGHIGVTGIDGVGAGGRSRTDPTCVALETIRTSDPQIRSWMPSADAPKVRHESGAALLADGIKIRRKDVQHFSQLAQNRHRRITLAAFNAPQMTHRQSRFSCQRLLA